MSDQAAYLIAWWLALAVPTVLTALVCLQSWGMS